MDDQERLQVINARNGKSIVDDRGHDAVTDVAVANKASDPSINPVRSSNGDHVSKPHMESDISNQHTQFLATNEIV